MAYEEFQQSNPQLWVKTNRLWSAGEDGMRELFSSDEGHSPSAPVPFPHQARSSNRLAYFDHDAIHEARQRRETEEIDPRSLTRAQPSITHSGMRYYMGNQYDLTGATYADHGPSNATPVVYEANHPHFGYPERTILAGHHRSTADLLKGRPLRAVLVRAPYLR